MLTVSYTASVKTLAGWRSAIFTALVEKNIGKTYQNCRVYRYKR